MAMSTAKAAYALLAALALPTTAARAMCAAPDPDIPVEAARVGEHVARVFFLGDSTMARGCPSDAVACRTKAFVVPGDVVLISNLGANYVCATFRNGRGATTTGWLPASSLEAQPRRPLGAADWIGEWTAPEQEIAISTDRSGALVLKGDATWGAGDPERVKRGGVNIGDFEAKLPPPPDVLAFTVGDVDTLAFDKGADTDCRVKMLRRGPYLIVADNNQCGGHNVTFSGIYRRAR